MFKVSSVNSHYTFLSVFRSKNIYLLISYSRKGQMHWIQTALLSVWTKKWPPTSDIILSATYTHTYYFLCILYIQYHILKTFYLCSCSSCSFALSQVQYLHIEPEAMEISSQQDLERKMAGLRNEVQVQIMLLYAIMLCFVDDKSTIYDSSSFCFFSLYFWAIVHGTCNVMFGGAARWVWF